MTTMTPTNTTDRDVLTVTQVNRQAKQLLERHFANIWIEGEISNISTPSSGHWYLTLKDDGAQIRCAMFRNRNMRLRFKPENGMRVIVRGKISLYEGRGDYQVILEFMQVAGDGALQQAYEALKRKLASEGLFNQQYKQSLPGLPQHIGIITSPSGAAVQDMLTVLKRRFPSIPISVIPVSVQGQPAAQEIADAIRFANRHNNSLSLPLDVLIVGRGGGSLEDLWSFNEEIVARAIFDSELPIVSAVGHEVDVTIADYVADVRAPTPSAAAELLSPNRAEWLDYFADYENQFRKIIQQQISFKQQQLVWLSKHLKHPGSRLQEQAQRLDDLEIRLKNSVNQHIKVAELRLSHQREKWLQAVPTQQIDHQRQHVANLQHLLQSNIKQVLQRFQHRFTALTQVLDTVSPLATLHRGYAIVSNEESGAILTSVDDLQPGDNIQARLSAGEFSATVKNISPAEKEDKEAAKQC